MATHREARADEIFVGNTVRSAGRVVDLQAKGVRTARLGDVAYCIYGKPLPNFMAPLLIGRSEAAIYDDIMMTAGFGPDWRRNR